MATTDNHALLKQVELAILEAKEPLLKRSTMFDRLFTIEKPPKISILSRIWAMLKKWVLMP